MSCIYARFLVVATLIIAVLLCHIVCSMNVTEVDVAVAKLYISNGFTIHADFRVHVTVDKPSSTYTLFAGKLVCTNDNTTIINMFAVVIPPGSTEGTDMVHIAFPQLSKYSCYAEVANTRSNIVEVDLVKMCIITIGIIILMVAAFTIPFVKLRTVNKTQT